MLSDYHIHSHFSNDSNENTENIVKRAIELGMKSICFTDHQDFCWPNPNECFDIDVENYFTELKDLQDKYRSSINIKIGAECGITPKNALENRQFVNSNTFDYIIGSCHIVDEMDPYYSEYWEGKSDRLAFEQYFKSLFSGLKLFNDIDTLGHIDYVVRYSPNKDANYSPSDYFDVIDEILKLIISKDIALEINTSAISKGLGFTNPHEDIIKRYAELGGKLAAVGSDAHVAKDLGCGFDIAERFLDKYNLVLIDKIVI